MKKQSAYIKTIFAALAILATVQIVYAATASSVKSSGGGNENQISLKNISKYKRCNTIPSLKFSQFQYKGSSNFSPSKSNGTFWQMQSTIRLQSGNTTYVYPYKYKTKLQQVFKTPTK